MRLRRIVALGLMRPDRIGIPAAASAPRILITQA
jgi:hypothetical protein